MYNKTKITNDITYCEAAYLACFTECYENDTIKRFRDDSLTDMYNHNYTYVKRNLLQEELQKLILEESAQNQKENKQFIKVSLAELPDVSQLDTPFGKLSTEHYGNYIYTPMVSPGWNSRDGFTIKSVSKEAMVEDIVSMDLISDAKSCGEDFCIRRARRRGKVYLSDSSIDCYIIYSKDIPVGKCDLFLSNDTAKIEDFVVLPAYQRQGIGTTLLKHLIDTALTKGAKTIYLTADEDDTPKDMYMRLGFERVFDYYSLFAKLT
jgi:spore maturation protein CgeE